MFWGDSKVPGQAILGTSRKQEESRGKQGLAGVGAT